MPENLFSEFSDSTLYFVMGCLGVVLMLIRIVLMMFGGFDADAGGDVDAAHGDGDGDGFGLFSVFSVVAFMAGFGWMGYAARTQWEMGGLASATVAFVFGFLMMLLAASMMFYIRKLNASGRYDLALAVGRVGKAYRRIPEKGGGNGEVQITVDGTQRFLAAKSVGPAIDSFSAVRVVELDDDGTLIVEPHN